MPARLKRIIAVAAEYGIAFSPPSSGSHWKAKKDGFRTYPVPAHNGERTEISDPYIRGLCRNFGIAFEEFLAKL